MTERRPLVISGNNVSELPQTDTLPGVQVLHGWPFPYAVTLSYSAANRQVTITPTGATFDIWVGGVKYTKTGAVTSTAHANTTGDYFLYYDTDGELKWIAGPWDMKVVSPTCYVYYNASITAGIALMELHTAKRNPEWHESQHYAIGTFVRSGLEISGYTLNTDSSAAVTFGIASGVIVDEDIEATISQLNDPGPYTILRRSGANDWTWTIGETLPYLSAATYIQYNQLSGGSYTMTEAVNNRWVNYYVFAMPSLVGNTQLVVIPGQAIHTTLSSAQAEGAQSIQWGTILIPEIVGVWKLTYATSSGYTGVTGRVRLVEVNRLTNTKGQLSVSISTSTHNSLTGRDVSETHPASAISNVPAGNIAATDVQAAINELDSEKAATGHTHAQLHDPVTVADSTSIDLTLTGQQISAAAIFGSTEGTVAEGGHLNALIQATGAFGFQYDAGGPINRANAIYHTLMAH